MVFDIEMIRQFYSAFGERVERVRRDLKRPLTLAEKILYVHLYEQGGAFADYTRGSSYADFRPDRVAMQDATAQMALLQFMNAGKPAVAVPSTVHCDHLIQAYKGADTDLDTANRVNDEVYHFLRSCASRYGIGFWRPGAGIIHQIVLENYAFPGGMMVGTDSHTPNAGGLGMLAIGVGGADAVDVMTGMEWELKFPRIIGVKLTGKLGGWTSPKDVILKIAGILTVKGGTDAIIEYFGEGTQSLSCTGKASVCNMGAEVGATTSVFPYDERMAQYLNATGREEISRMAGENAANLRADKEVEAEPEKYYDRVIEINLSELEPYVNGPFTPDAAFPVGEMKERVADNDYPDAVDVVLIGSCTNSSYQDLSRAASVLEQAMAKGIEPRAQLIVNPGSDKVSLTADRDGILKVFSDMSAILMANACGPCIGQWRRVTDDNTRRNSIVTSFNRNFAKRADGNPNTHAFITSPELAMAFFLSGSLSFNPMTDTLLNKKGEAVMLEAPKGIELPEEGFEDGRSGYLAPEGAAVEVSINPDSERLQRLAPFAPNRAEDYLRMPLLIKVQGKCTTDHISMAGPWLKYRGHLDHISDNMLLGASNFFTGKTGETLNQTTGEYANVAAVARSYKAAGLGSVIVAEENYGEGSSREHAAMEPRFLGVRVVRTKSFARIHETNLKKQGMLALMFANKEDYDKIGETDTLSIPRIDDFAPGRNITITITRKNGESVDIEAKHTYNEQQIKWFKAGSALNVNDK